MRHTISTTVGAPADVVWSVLTDVEDWPRWTESMTRVVRRDTGRLRIGSEAEIKQPGFPAATWRVTDLEPGTSFTWVSSGPGLTSQGEHRVLPAGDGAVLELGLDLRGPAAPVAALVFGRRFRRWVAMEARGLRRAAEAAIGAASDLESGPKG